MLRILTCLPKMQAIVPQAGAVYVPDVYMTEIFINGYSIRTLIEDWFLLVTKSSKSLAVVNANMSEAFALFDEKPPINLAEWTWRSMKAEKDRWT